MRSRTRTDQSKSPSSVKKTKTIRKATVHEVNEVDSAESSVEREKTPKKKSKKEEEFTNIKMDNDGKAKSKG